MLLFILNYAAYGQDTNRNLRAVDKMLERYRDIGEHKAAVVHAVCICLLANYPSICLSSAMFVHPTQAIEIFGNVFTPFGTLAICDLSIKILWRSSQGNPFVGGRGVKLKRGSQI